MSDLSTVTAAQEWLREWRDHYAYKVTADEQGQEYYRARFQTRVAAVAVEQRKNLDALQRSAATAAHWGLERLAEYERAVAVLEAAASSVAW